MRSCHPYSVVPFVSNANRRAKAHPCPIMSALHRCWLILGLVGPRLGVSPYVLWVVRRRCPELRRHSRSYLRAAAANIGWDSIRVLFGSLLPNVHRHSFALAVLTHAVHAWQLCSKSRGLLPRFAAQPGMGGGASQRAVSHLFEGGISLLSRRLSSRSRHRPGAS